MNVPDVKVAAPGARDGQPGFAFGVEPFGRDER